MTQIWRQTT